RPRLEDGLHDPDPAEGPSTLYQGGHRRPVLFRAAGAGARLGRIPQRPDDRGHASRTDRGDSRMTAWNGLRALAAVTLTSLSLSACETNPATGKQSFTGLVSPKEEIELTKEEHPKIIAQYGEYQDPQLQRYIEDLGEKLAAHSERTDLPWKFTILDTSDVNAFALPGGYIYVNRGLLSLASSEAEVASVLSHETGHVNARHSAQRQGQATIAGIGAALASILTGSSAVGQLANVVGTGYIQSYSREQELEADS